MEVALAALAKLAFVCHRLFKDIVPESKLFRFLCFLSCSSTFILARMEEVKY